MKYYIRGKKDPKNIFVYLGGTGCYCPIGQHGELSLDYLAECKEISRDEYMKIAGWLYTPEDYLKV